MQAFDTRLDQLAHSESTLPEAQQFRELTDRLAELKTDAVNASTELSDLEAEVARAEREVEQVQTRTKKDQDLLDSGAITSGKQLEEIQHEITSLVRRQGELEDVQLEIMERAEVARTKVEALTESVSATKSTATDVRTALDAAVSEIASERADVHVRRDALVADVPDDLLALYSKLRESLGGVGAAPLRGSRCEGCHMQLAPTDLKKIVDAEPDEVTRCEDCRRILIRTGVN